MPNRLNLQSKGISIPSACVFCDTGLEDSWHLFYACPNAQDSWEVSNMSSYLTQIANNVKGFSEFCFQILVYRNEENKGNFFMIC